MYATISWRQAVSPFYKGCPLLRVSIIRGSTVAGCMGMADIHGATAVSSELIH